MQEKLYWSRKGEIACETHAPGVNDPRWDGEEWEAIPPGRGR